MRLSTYDSFKNSGVEWLENIPEHWESKRVKNILDSIVGGGTPKTDNAEYWDGLIPWISPKDMKSDYINSSIDTITEKAILESATNLVEINSILIVVRSGILKHTLPVAINTVPVAINQDLKALKPKKEILATYLLWCLKGLSGNILALCNKVGATVDSIEVENLINFTLFIPPNTEQILLSDYLEQKTKAIDKKLSLLKKKVEYYKELSKSIINEAVCRGLNKDVPLKDSGIEWIGKIPKKWEVRRLKDIITKFVGGGTPDTNRNEYWTDFEKEGYLWVSISDITNAEIITDTNKYITEIGLKNSSATLIKPNSILYSIYASLGKVAYSNKPVTTNQAILALYENKSKVFNSYLIYFFKVLEQHINSLGNSNTQNNISLSILRTIPIAFPSLKEQVEIAEYLDHKTTTIQAIIKNITTQIEVLKELRKTLINDVVTGKLKVEA